MEYKATRADVKAASKREIEGYAAVFGNRDSHGDIIQPGAFKRTLAVPGEMRRVKVLYQHDARDLIGKPTSLLEDEKGLHVRARIADTALGRDIMSLAEAEILEELSIGYQAIDFEFDSKTETRFLKELKLIEVSPVTWASNELARITAVKHASDLDLILDRLSRIEWAKGRLESPRLREKAGAAVKQLQVLLDGEPPTETVPSPPGAARDTEGDPDPVHSLLEPLSALNTKLRAASIAQELRAFGETIPRGTTHG